MIPRKGGFTLIELVVALTIAALALAVVPMSMVKLHDTVQFRTSVRDLLSGLKSARVEAMRSGRPIVFLIDPDEKLFSVGGGPTTHLKGDIRVGVVVADREVAGERGGIRFYPDGSSTGGAIVVSRPSGGGVKLRVDWLLGRVFQEAAS